MSLDPEFLQMLVHLPQVESGPIDYSALRSQQDGMLAAITGPAGPIPVGGVEQLEIEGPGGQVPLNIYRPETQPTGTLHFMHGGAWCGGSLALIDPYARRLARDLSMVVVTSTYRLMPEHPFPAGFDDSMAAARWVLAHSKELGGADLPVAIGGESAGGNLAAAICLALRDSPPSSEKTQFDAQLLFFPALDLRDSAATNPSRKRDADPILRTGSMPYIVGDYAGGHDRSDPRMSPLATDCFANLPATVLVALTVDPLYDEAVVFAECLHKAGVTVDLIEFDHLAHGFVGLANILPAAAKASSLVHERFKSLLHASV